MTEFEPELGGRRFFTGLFRNRREHEGLTFVKRNIHHPFVKKVYTLLILMVLLLVPIACIAAYLEPARSYMKEDPLLPWIGYFTALVLFIIIMCFSNLRRKKPVGYLLLILMFISITPKCMHIAASYSSVMVYVFVSILVSAVFCLGLSLLAFSTNYDFTRFWYDLYIALVIVDVSPTIIVVLIVSAITQSEIKIVTVIIATLQLALYSTFFVADTQLMLGGRRRYIYYRDEYVVGVVHLLIDVLFMTQSILNIIVSTPMHPSSPVLILYKLGEENVF